MPLRIEAVPSSETLFLLPVLLETDEGVERIRKVLLDPTCTAYAAWLDDQLAGAAVIRWEANDASEIIYIEVASALRGQGYGKQIIQKLQSELPQRVVVSYWLGQPMRRWRTLLSIKNVAFVCTRSNVTSLPTFSHQYLSTEFSCATCSFCVTNYTDM